MEHMVKIEEKYQTAVSDSPVVWRKGIASGSASRKVDRI